MIDTDIRFHERQRFTQWWLLLLVIDVPIIMGLVHYFVEPIPFWIYPLTLLPMLLILGMHLDVAVTGSELHLRFFPFVSKRWAFAEIAQCHARTYSPIGEYGGWGIRGGFGHGRAYNVKGNRGVQLVLSDGTKILIGSQRADELEAAIGRR